MIFVFDHIQSSSRLNTVEESDAFGRTVNFAARVVGSIKEAEIWLSYRAKEDIDRLGAVQHKQLGWQRHDGVAIKGSRYIHTAVSKTQQSYSRID